jgi:hypothetical protein
LFGAIEEGSEGKGIATIPGIRWEASLGVYLTVGGFWTSPITAVGATVPSLSASFPR